jgi:anthranilate phosphoribosyltransferase
LDEVTLSGPTDVTLVTADGRQELRWQPEDFGVPGGADDSLLADTPAASAAVIREILEGRPSAARNIVVLNAAAALWVAEAVTSLPAAAAAAAQAIDEGRAAKLLQQLAEASHQ